MTACGFIKHPKALVDQGADIGARTRVWAFAHVMSGAQVGSDCNICDYAFVESGVRLGNQVTVKNGVQIYRGVEVADDVFLGPGCVFTNHRIPRAFIKSPEEAWLQKTWIQRGATIGAGAVIICGNTIGRYAFVAAGAVVTRDVPDHALVKGTPARFHAWVCQCGEKLAFENDEAVCVCSLAYRKDAGNGRVVLVEA